jgi:hypothetical protein
MAMTKVTPHADHKRPSMGASGPEYHQASSRDGGYAKVSDSKFYSRGAGEIAPEVRNDGPRNTNAFADKIYAGRKGEYAQVSAKTDGMCK